MNELKGNDLVREQREALDNGELRASIDCSHSDCWSGAEWWVVLRHPKRGEYRVPRCDSHKNANDVDREVVRTEVLSP